MVKKIINSSLLAAFALLGMSTPNLKALETSAPTKIVVGTLGLAAAYSVGKLMYNKWYVIGAIDQKLIDARIHKKALSAQEIAQAELVLENFIHWKLPLCNSFEHDLQNLYAAYQKKVKNPQPQDVSWAWYLFTLPLTTTENLLSWWTSEQITMDDILIEANKNADFYKFVKANLGSHLSHLFACNGNYGNAARVYWKLMNHKYQYRLFEAVKSERECIELKKQAVPIASNIANDLGSRLRRLFGLKNS